MMDKYELRPSYRSEFYYLEPVIRPIRTFSSRQIVQALFERIGYRVIRSAKDFRTLHKIFRDTRRNEDEIYNFLTDPDMSIKDLANRTGLKK